VFKDIEGWLAAHLPAQ